MSAIKCFNIIRILICIFLITILKENDNLKLSKSDLVDIQAGSLSSKQSIIPFGFNKLEICQSIKHDKTYTLAEILTGEELFSTDYFANIDENKFCEEICSNEFKERTINSIKKLIKREYYSNWYIDNLPAGLLLYNNKKKKCVVDYFKGIPLGYFDKADNKYYIYNHLQFHILINKIKNDKYNIVGFNILPISIDYNSINKKNNKYIFSRNNTDYPVNEEIPKQELKEGNITFTYDTIFESSDIKFKSRWNNYKKKYKKFRWAGLIYSNLLIIIFSLIIFIIFSNNVKNDIDIYNYRVAKIESIDDFNWKQVYGDVFRAPSKKPMLFSSLIGTGFQLFLKICFFSFLGIFSYMSPESGINLINFSIISFFISGIPGGYMATKFYRIFGGLNLAKISLLTSFLFPVTAI